jgi:hypothetical protein
MNIDEVIVFLKDATTKTYSSEDRCRLLQAADVLYNMKMCNCLRTNKNE